jgi:hypothetical protein
MPRQVSAKKQQEIRNFITDLIEELEEFKIRRFGGRPINPIVRMTFLPQYKQSSASGSGGRYRLFFTCHVLCFQHTFVEYDHIKYDDEIGEIRHGGSPNWRKSVAATVCHEYAHLLDYRKIPTPKSCHCCAYDSEKFKGHGEEWQYYYRILRRNFVNGRYED